jgi:hypothetical protein
MWPSTDFADIVIGSGEPQTMGGFPVYGPPVAHRCRLGPCLILRTRMKHYHCRSRDRANRQAVTVPVGVPADRLTKNSVKERTSSVTGAANLIGCRLFESFAGPGNAVIGSCCSPRSDAGRMALFPASSGKQKSESSSPASETGGRPKHLVAQNATLVEAGGQLIQIIASGTQQISAVLRLDKGIERRVRTSSGIPIVSVRLMKHAVNPYPDSTRSAFLAWLGVSR